MFGSFDVAVSGMRVQRTRMNTIAQNLANLNTTRNEAGQSVPYRRRIAVFAEGARGEGTPGVRVAEIARDPGPFREVYDPHHPDAGPDGAVRYPNVDMVTEQVNAMEAARAFEANAAAFEMNKSMIVSALRILA